MIDWVPIDVFVLCACTSTLILSVVAATLANHEVKTGRSPDPLKGHPRHKRHRRRQRACSQVETSAVTTRPDSRSIVADVAHDVREATSRPPDGAPMDYEALARRLLPAASRLRSPIRSTDLTDSQRRELIRFKRLIEQYGERFGSGSLIDRISQCERLHEVADEVYQTYGDQTTTHQTEGE
jgi:hypothetical protein